jgi:hypothetical protein
LGKPSGYDALAQGVVWQNRVAEEWKAAGFEVSVGWGHDQPDIALSFPEGVPPVVVSVKTFNLVPSNLRYGRDGRHSYASARTITRKDVIAEIAYALSNRAYTVILTVVNQRNGVAEHVELDPTTFSQYTTSQRLNDDNGEREYTINDLMNPATQEASEGQGWTRITNPRFDSKGQQIN